MTLRILWFALGAGTAAWWLKSPCSENQKPLRITVETQQGRFQRGCSLGSQRRPSPESSQPDHDDDEGQHRDRRGWTRRDWHREGQDGEVVNGTTWSWKGSWCSNWADKKDKEAEHWDEWHDKPGGCWPDLRWPDPHNVHHFRRFFGRNSDDRSEGRGPERSLSRGHNPTNTVPPEVRHLRELSDMFMTSAAGASELAVDGLIRSMEGMREKLVELRLAREKAEQEQRGQSGTENTTDEKRWR